ncbi:cell wall hydrolase [Sphingosinicella sp. YJ22]|uniref:cell wall hydrolase n=1 Tax=Sphingosinicella sp. YJ22 TaxID=1104780 RepID=UPI00140E10C8|nr:cell wall hydrolase [Sphingosinicella sp. YJ22]
MFSRGKFLSATVGAAALTGTLFVPASNLLASPAPQAAVIEAPALPQTSVPAPQASAAAPVQPAIVETPAVVAPEAPAAEESEAVSVSARELECMTKVILYEAGAESRTGQVAVAQVVMNRVESPRFPDSICGVIYQRGQFSAIRSFNPPRNARWNRAMALARDVLDGHEAVVGEALYFHATRVRPAFVRSRTRVATIGNHVFYR